ncbi:hypothetical protein KR067_009113 [Drosophila pandora]|nr:hypothetical protein KR067_009113 [Drosophila pandora]
MATKPKKEVLCDYCGSNNEAKHIYSAQKSFVSRKVLELLEIITHKNLPNNVGFKVCFLCASTLMSTVGVIEKTQKLVEDCLVTLANKKKKPVAKGKEVAEEEAKETVHVVEESHSDSEEEENQPEEDDDVVDITEDGGKPEPKITTPKITTPKITTPKITSPPKKINTTIRQRSKSMAALSVAQINHITQSPIGGSPKKVQLKQTTLVDTSQAKQTPKKQDSRQEDNLIDSVKITPSKEIAPKKKVFLQLFGTSNNEQLETESDTDESDTEQNKRLVQVTPQEFDCRMCDFKSKFPKLFKEHLTKEHGQQRPRIYYCDACPKSFGVLKSLKDHLSTAHGVTLESAADAETKKPKEAKPKDAKLKKGKATETKSKPENGKETKENIPEEDSDVPVDLNASEVKNKIVEKVINNDYTFAVNGSSASTPVAGSDTPQFAEFKCDICDSEFTSAKLMQEHITKAHGIEKPKIFKCHICGRSLATKKTLAHHIKLHQEGAADTKRKILQEDEKDADNLDSSKKEAAAPVEGKTAAKKDTTKESKKEKAPKKVKEDKPKNQEAPVEAPKEIKETTQPEDTERPVSSFKALNESAVKKKRSEKTVSNDDPFALSPVVGGESPKVPKFKCDVCDSVFSSVKLMKNHVEKAHGIEKPKIFKCHICQKSLATKQTLTYHIKTLHEEEAKENVEKDEEELDNVDSPVAVAEPKRKKAVKKSLPREQAETTAEAKPQEVDTLMAAPKSPVKKVKKDKKQVNNSQDDSLPSVSLDGDKLNKSGKRKLKVNQSVDQDGPASSNNDSTMEESVSSQQLLNEVNTNVRPHKKARLDSIISIGEESNLDSTTDETTDFNCDQCGKTVTSRKRLDSHIQKKHGVKLQCPVCKDSHRLQLDYVAHFADCSALDGLPCGVPMCKKVFADANYLSTHLRKRHQWS